MSPRPSREDTPVHIGGIVVLADPEGDLSCVIDVGES